MWRLFGRKRNAPAARAVMVSGPSSTSAGSQDAAAIVAHLLQRASAIVKERGIQIGEAFTVESSVGRHSGADPSEVINELKRQVKAHDLSVHGVLDHGIAFVRTR